MSTFDPDRELTDEELDAALTTANSDLLGYVRAIADPSDLLLALMDRDDGAAQERGPVDHSLHGGAAIRVIVQRRLAHALDRVLAYAYAYARSRNLTRALVRDRDLTRALAHYLDRALDLAHELAHELDPDLDRDRNLDRNLAHELAHVLDRALAFAHELDRARELAHANELARARNLAHAREVARELDLDRSLAHELARNLTRRFEAAAIDVSGADLSHLDLGPRDVEVLVGVVWTQETRWPPGIAAELTTWSEEIQPGVYQVRRGSERDPLNLGLI